MYMYKTHIFSITVLVTYLNHNQIPNKKSINILMYLKLLFTSIRFVINKLIKKKKKKKLYAMKIY